MVDEEEDDGGLSALEGHFLLSSNRLTGAIPTQIGGLSAVESVFNNLYFNRLTGTLRGRLRERDYYQETLPQGRKAAGG